MAQPLVAIVGETGSGKSELAMRIAKNFSGEIICADAWTARKGMDIGSAKPSQQDRREVPHHMLDLVDPDAKFNVAEFKTQADVLINNIHKRNKLPVIVGGSGLYIDSVLYNYSFLTTDSNTDRNELNNLSREELLELIHEEHISTEDVDTFNKRRLIRLIETKGGRSTRRGLRGNCLIIGLQIDQDMLTKRLEDRLEKMLKLGLEQEVKELADKFGWEVEAMKGVGYKEWQDYFSGSINEAELKERIIKDSRRLAKKQRTWFKRNADIKWLSTPVKWKEVVDLMTTIISTEFQ